MTKVLVTKPRRKIWGDNLKNLFNEVKFISEQIYKKFAQDSYTFYLNYFPYFRLVGCCGNYQHHFLVVRKDSCRQNINCSHRIATNEFKCFYFCLHFYDAFKKWCGIINAVLVVSYTFKKPLLIANSVRKLTFEGLLSEINYLMSIFLK